MNQPCTNRIVCPGPATSLDADDPIINFSSEAVDGINFTEMAWPITDFTNPFTPDDPNNPPDTCDSPISQAEAELCAISKVFQDQAALNGRSGSIVFNSQQTCAFNCPDGSAFFWTVPAGVFADFNQSAADQKAKAYACKQVSLNAVCIKVDSTSACLGAFFLSVVTVDGGFSPYSIKMIAGTLPPGVGFVQDTNTTGFFSGVPSSPGIYSVAISAKDTHGNVITRTVTFTVLAISNANAVPTPAVGTFYNFQLQGTGGTAPYTFSGGVGLPGGLVLQSDGFIVGNPVAPIGTGFTATLTDAGGNSCSFALTYSGCSFFNGAVWDSPIDTLLHTAPPNSDTFAQTFPTPHSVEINGTCTMVLPGQVLTGNNTALVTVPAGGATCKLRITVKASSGYCAFEIAIFDATFTTTYFDTTNIVQPPIDVTNYTFTIPNGVTQIALSWGMQIGNPVGVSGTMDIRVDFGV